MYQVFDSKRFHNKGATWFSHFWTRKPPDLVLNNLFQLSSMSYVNRQGCSHCLHNESITMCSSSTSKGHFAATHWIVTHHTLQPSKSRTKDYVKLLWSIVFLLWRCVQNMYEKCFIVVLHDLVHLDRRSYGSKMKDSTVHKLVVYDLSQTFIRILIV